MLDYCVVTALTLYSSSLFLSSLFSDEFAKLKNLLNYFFFSSIFCYRKRWIDYCNLDVVDPAWVLLVKVTALPFSVISVCF